MLYESQAFAAAFAVCLSADGFLLSAFVAAVHLERYFLASGRCAYAGVVLLHVGRNRLSSAAAPKILPSPRIMNGSIWLLSLAIAAAAYFAVPFSNGLLCGAYGIATAACFWGGTKLVMLPLERMTHPYVLIGIAALDCVVGFLLYLSSSSLPAWITLLLFGADCCFFAWMHNGHAVESLLSGRGNESWEMPKEIRRSNFRLMGIFVLLARCCCCAIVRLQWCCGKSGGGFILAYGMHSAGCFPGGQQSILLTCPLRRNSIWKRSR